MNITRVEIKNFQSHENTKIDFTNGINVFVGPSDSGKSAILRAIKWNLRNTPSGKEFIKEGAEEASVTVHWEDGHSVERVRSKGSKNTYTLLKDGVVLQEYTGFGGNVPPEILEVTGIDLNMNFNFANQLEAPFLLSETPKVRAETIGNLEELGKIDSELTKLNEDVRFKKKEQKATQAKMKGLEQERTELLNELNVSKVKADTIRELKESIIEKNRIYEAIKRSAYRIRTLEEEVVMVRATLERAERILATWDDQLPDRMHDINRLNAMVIRLVQLRSEAELIRYMNDDQLEQLINLSSYASEMVTSYQRLVQLKTRLERNIAEGNRLKGSYVDRVAAIEFAPIDLEVARFTELFNRKQRLKTIEATEKDLNNRVAESEVEINKLLNQLLDALHDAETCPTCMQSTESITEHKIAHSI